MMNNVSLNENWYGKWWNIANNENSTNKYQNMNNKNHQQPSTQSKSESFITKQLKIIREKAKDDQRRSDIEKEKERAKDRAIQKLKEKPKTSEVNDVIEAEKSKNPPKQGWNLTVNTKNKNRPNSERSQEMKNLTEDEAIVRDYDVEFYMKRGLTKTEAINYIKNKLTVKNLWSKMRKTY